jgi:hypothetical protein
MAITTNLRGHMQEFYGVFEEVLEDLGNHEDLQRLHDHVSHRESVSSLRELLEDAGFAVARVIERQAFMRFADGTALLRHHFIKLGFLDAWKRVVPSHERTVFEKLVARLDERARRDGELKLTIPMAYVEAKPGPLS